MRGLLFGFIGVVCAAVAGQWAFVTNAVRQQRHGWTTTVDTDVVAPDATGIYWPLARVAGVDAPQPLPRRPDPRFDALRGVLRETQSYAVLVWHNGAIGFEQYDTGATADSRPDGASMHKTIAALAIGAAIGEGKLTLDQTLAPAIDEWRDDPRGAIGLRDVLTMSSGLATFAPGGVFSESYRFLGGLLPERLVLSRPLAVPPGTQFAYRNLNTQLLGMVLERSTGASYAEYLSSRLWQPIGAADAYVWLDRPGGLARSYTALLARAEDWLRIGLLIKNGGRVGDRQVIPAGYLDAMVAPAATNPNYGFQIWRAEPYQAMRYYNPASKTLGSPASAPLEPADTVFLDGVGGQRVYISRSADTVIVRLGVAQKTWDDALLPNAVADALRPRPPAE